MRRRDFIKAVVGAVTAWPLTARAQQQHPMPVMAFLKSTTPEDSAHLVRAFRQGLSEAGFAEGRNVTIEYRWAENQLDRLPELVAELVRRRVAVIATPADTPATLVAKAATATIPIVFEIGGDPVRAGLVASFNQPGGNVTGITSMNLELAAKQLGFLHELLPQANVLPCWSIQTIPLLPRPRSQTHGQRLFRLGGKLKSLPRAPIARLMWSLRASGLSRLTHSWSVTIRSSTAAAYTSSRWRRTIGCQRSTPIVSPSKLGE